MFTPYLLTVHEAPTSLWESIVHSNIINFCIALGFLIWVFWKFQLGNVLVQRQAQIVKSLQEAEAQREKALEDLRLLEQRAAQLEVEVQGILKQAEATAAMVAENIIQSATEEADKMLRNAQRRVELEQRQAARELERRLTLEALHGAQELLENTLSKEDKLRSVEDFVNALPSLVKKEVQR